MRRIGHRYGFGRAFVERADPDSAFYLAKYIAKRQDLWPGMRRWGTVGGFDHCRKHDVIVEGGFSDYLALRLSGSSHKRPYLEIQAAWREYMTGHRTPPIPPTPERRPSISRADAIYATTAFSELRYRNHATTRLRSACARLTPSAFPDYTNHASTYQSFAHFIAFTYFRLTFLADTSGYQARLPRTETLYTARA
jgi:hypothetical protein